MLIAQRPTLTEEVVSDRRSRFVIEPLEPGFGYTLGNSLRRTLLSSIPGAAVTSIRVDGVLHEFSTVNGVKEDVTEIILNIKKLSVSSENDEPVVAYLRKQGAGVVTAADITAPAGVEVRWLHRGGPFTPETTRFAAAVEGAAWRDGRVHAFVHGEREQVKRVRAYLTDVRGVDRRQLSVSAYWAYGRAEDVFQAEKQTPAGQIFEDGATGG